MRTGPEFWRQGPIRRFRKRREVMFGQVREDTALESILARGRTLCIASGGETAFDLLLGGAETVWAVDINPAQVWLVELKLACMRDLPYEEFLHAITENATSGFHIVQGRLSTACRGYFEKRPRVLARGLQNCGTVDRFLRAMAKVFQMAVVSRARQEQLLMLRSPEDQQVFFLDKWNTWQWRALLRLQARTWPLRALFGRDAVRGLSRSDLKSLADDVEHVLCDAALHDNPYVWQAMLGRYPPSTLPKWLTREGLQQLKERLDQLHIAEGDISDVLDSAEEPFDQVCLSNVLDVTDPTYPEQLINALLKGTRPGSLVIARSFFPFPEHSRPGRPNLVELSRGALALKELPPWTDRSFFCRNVSLMQVCG